MFIYGYEALITHFREINSFNNEFEVDNSFAATEKWNFKIMLMFLKRAENAQTREKEKFWVHGLGWRSVS